MRTTTQFKKKAVNVDGARRVALEGVAVTVTLPGGAQVSCIVADEAAARQVYDIIEGAHPPASRSPMDPAGLQEVYVLARGGA